VRASHSHCRRRDVPKAKDPVSLSRRTESDMRHWPKQLDNDLPKPPRYHTRGSSWWAFG
jgi:hypothetical protein